MATTTYTYDIATELPLVTAAQIDTGFLYAAVVAAGVTEPLAPIAAPLVNDGTSVIISFANALSAPDKAILDNVMLTYTVVTLLEDGFCEIVRTTGRVTQVIVWNSPAKLSKIKDTTISRVSGQVSEILVEDYDFLGVITQTTTSTIARVGGRVDTIDSVVS